MGARIAVRVPSRCPLSRARVRVGPGVMARVTTGPGPRLGLWLGSGLGSGLGAGRHLHGRHAITARIRTTNATTVPSTKHLPTNGTRERSEVCSATAVAVVVGARKLPLFKLRLLKLSSLPAAVELGTRAPSAGLASSSSLDGLFRLRGPLPSMLSVVRGAVDMGGTLASMHCSRTGAVRRRSERVRGPEEVHPACLS